MISKRYLQLLEDMKKLHEAKNAGYSGDSTDSWANFRNSENLNVPASVGCLIRLSDKYARVINLMKSPENDKVGEAIDDTLMDLASYALIAICLIEEENL